jgi:ABC-type glycerol-3-phosphate transport system substrate-binding protein
MKKLSMLLLAILLVSGCIVSSPEEEGPEERGFVGEVPAVKPDIPMKNRTLNVWTELDYVMFLEEVADEFERAYDIEVRVMPIIREDITPYAREVFPFDLDPPAVVHGHVYAIAPYGLVEPMTQRLDAWNPHALDQFLPIAVDEMTWQGTLYGVPFDIYTYVLLYNRAHFDQANLPYPTGDYDVVALREAAAILTKPEAGRHGIGMTTDARYLYAWLTAAGTDVLTGSAASGYGFKLDTPANAKALAFLTDFIELEYAPLPSSRARDYEEARELFLRGQISMYLGDPHDIHLIRSTKPDFPLGVAPLPRAPAENSPTSILVCTGLFIPHGALDPEMGFEFIKWAISDRYTRAIPRRIGHYPPKQWLLTSPEFTNDLLLAPFFSQLETARPYRLDLFPEAEEGLSDAIKTTFYDLAGPVEALHEAQKSTLPSEADKNIALPMDLIFR